MDDLDEIGAAIERYTPPVEPYLAALRHGPPSWLDELDPKPAPPHHRMATHALSLDDWFVVDELRPTELELRARLIDERRADVCSIRPAATDAARETLELIRDWLDARGLAPTMEAADDEPLVQAGRLVQDDLCLMIRHDGGWSLDAAVLCFPAVWRLQEKLGRSLAEIHIPVEHYDDDLSERVDRFFDRLRVDRPVWRRNLSVQPTHALFLPYSKARRPPQQRGLRPDEGPSLWLRSERQTLRLLPRSGAILFTIRTQLAPIGVLADRPVVAGRLLATLRSWDERMRQFKFADPTVEHDVLGWLSRIATPGEG